MGRYCPKEGKNRRKVHYFLSTHQNMKYGHSKKQSSSLNRSLGRQVEDEVFSRVCVALAFQQRCCFFAITSVTQGTEVERQVGENAGKGRKKNHRFLSC